MVSARKAIESLYSHRCDVYEKQKTRKENKITAFEYIKVLEDIKCHLSFESTKTSTSDGKVYTAYQTVKLFLAPERKIRAGSKITIKDSKGNIFEYKASGEPNIYDTHQEVMLERNEED